MRYTCARHLRETSFRFKDTDALTAEGWKNIYHVNGDRTRARMVTLIADRRDLKTKIVIKEKGEIL